MIIFLSFFFILLLLLFCSFVWSLTLSIRCWLYKYLVPTNIIFDDKTKQDKTKQTKLTYFSYWRREYRMQVWWTNIHIKNLGKHLATRDLINQKIFLLPLTNNSYVKNRNRSESFFRWNARVALNVAGFNAGVASVESILEGHVTGIGRETGDLRLTWVYNISRLYCPNNFNPLFPSFKQSRPT